MNKKRSCIFILVLVLFVSNFLNVHAEEDITAIQKLTDIGLIKKGEITTKIDSSCKRLEVYRIYIRIKGLETTAKAYKGKLTFKDSKSINKSLQPMVNYAKANPALGWTGIKDNFMPNSSVTVKNFTRYMLDVLGYKYNSDYKDNNMMTFAKNIKIIDDEDIKNQSNPIILDNAYSIIINLLRTNTKDKKILSNILISKKILNKTAVEKHRLNDPDSDLEIQEISADDTEE